MTEPMIVALIGALAALLAATLGGIIVWLSNRATLRLQSEQLQRQAALHETERQKSESELEKLNLELDELRYRANARQADQERERLEAEKLGLELRDLQQRVAKQNWQLDQAQRQRDLLNLHLARAKRIELAELQTDFWLSLNHGAMGLQLDQADLRRMRLSQMDLAHAHLDRADLLMADLSEANLAGASLCGANLTGANLRGATLRGARYDKRTKWPEGFDPVAAGAIAVDEDAEPTPDEE